MNNAANALIAAGALAVLATPILAQQRGQGSERLPPECRAEIAALCGTDRAQMRSCLREKYAELSDGCRTTLRDRMQAAGGVRGGAGAGMAAATASATLSYGEHQRQGIDLYLPAGATQAPLVVFVHGGGWSFGNRSNVQAKPQHFNAAGYAFASAGYRVLPDAPVEAQAADVGASLRALRKGAAAHGYDPDRIVLIGHSAGAHLAALVATDPAYAGEAFGAIKGVVLLDGAGYDVASQVRRSDNELPRIYEAAFGTDPARHKALSPITHVGGTDAPHWLALYVAERAGSRVQSEALIAALAQAGAKAQASAITGTDHGRMNREIGTPAGADQTAAIDSFLKRVLAS